MGVTFTEKSADRIAKVVKQVEGTPVGEATQQRRRSGGATVTSLFEVTEVQTTPETVTLKRVQDTADNLNDRSETEGIAYDPDNEPAVGDRGLIIRLGDGTRFFFRHGGNTQRVAVSEYSRVDDSTPDVTSDYKDIAGGNTASGAFYNSTFIGAEQRIIFKWPSQLSGITLADVTLCLGVNFLLAFTGFGPGNTAVGTTLVGLTLTHILDDFTASSLTWNILAGLSKGGSASIAHTRAGALNIKAGGSVDMTARSDILGASGMSLLPDPNSSYGLELKIVPITIPAQFTSYTLDVSPLTIKTSTAFISWGL